MNFTFPFFSVRKSISTLRNLISPESINLRLHGRTKEAVMNELPDSLAIQGKPLDRAIALKDLISL
jgi:hypothetical protein